MWLTFNRDHASNLAIIRKDELFDSLKALLDKGLHIAGLLGLSQDLQQLVVRQEEEPTFTQWDSGQSHVCYESGHRQLPWCDKTLLGTYRKWPQMQSKGHKVSDRA